MEIYEKAFERFKRWMERADKSIKEELKSIENNEKEIIERFYGDLEFGTGGMRGIIGAGTTRMNVHTVARASQGFANYLKKEFDFPSVVIAYDTRKNSDLFAKIASEVLAANDINVYIFKEPTATPILSFSVRHLKASGGIVITASHNPPQYNGYKVYTYDGTQAVPEIAEKIIAEINSLDYFDDVKRINFEEGVKSGKINWVDDNLLTTYLDILESYIRSLKPNMNTKLKIVYTPLNGTGLKPVSELLKRLGHEVYLVEEQAKPDPNFSTLKVPNPEEKDSFELALKLAKSVSADLVIATDPDSDRLGIYAKENYGYETFTGNEIGVMLAHFILSRLSELNVLPENGLIIKTIVSTDMVKEMAKEFNVSVEETLTGFKFIGQKIEKHHTSGTKKFIFGFEESYGFLANDHARDKDAVIAAGLISTLLSHLHSENKSLKSYLMELKHKYGFYKEKNVSFVFEGLEGKMKIQNIMEKMRKHPPVNVGSLSLSEMIDYQKGHSDLPKSNVVELRYSNKLKVIGRPSGTEPKIKFYIMVRGENENEAEEYIKLGEKVVGLIME